MNRKQAQIVIGLGFGDEGKGLCTDYLCRQGQNPLVIRFSGGHQAGHTVVNEAGDRHVFSSFGSGSLQGVPTYWSRYCTFFPIGFFNELLALESLALKPKIYIDALAPVTSPYDVYFNHYTETANRHGSCGLGFGSTIQRNDETPYKLYVKDLQYPVVLNQKLRAIEHYYTTKVGADFKNDSFQEKLGLFKKVIEDVLPCIEIVNELSFLKNNDYQALIFEGSQGILLDMDHGFFPNVTRCNTSTKNAMELIQRNELALPEIYYITRAYQTRHGNGYLSNEGLDLNVIPNPLETNQYNKWQGHQRQSILDLDMLNYAFDTDKNYSGNLKKNLLITCLDQLDGHLQASKNKEIKTYKASEEILSKLTLEPQKILLSYADSAKGIHELKMKEKIAVH